jgi:guanylate kinase
MNKKTLVFAGPSAVGKTYIAELLIRNYPNVFEQAKLYTTRKPRIGEKASDRIFISETSFESMVKRKTFIVHDTFSGANYGFTPECLYPKDKHLLVNAWPWLIPQFSTIPGVIIIGMQIPDKWEKLLELRMMNRGDNEETITIRKKLIEKDASNLSQNKRITEKHGRYFTVKSDETIPDEIMPWIIRSLNLLP